MSKETNTLQDYLDGKVTEENGNIENAVNTKTEKKDKKKNKLIALIALLLAGVTAIGVAIGFKNKNKTKADQTTTTSTVFSIDNLGMEEEFPTNSQYGNTTGDVKKENIVEKDGKYYADKESADKSDKVGQTKVDTQNGKLEVKPDGTVVEKETGSQDKDGNDIDMSKYITLDKNYYYKDGSLAFKKGEKVDKEDFDRVKHLLITDPKQATETTTKPETTKPETTTKPEETTVSSQGVVNKDGTYTIFGVTYMDKATFEAFVLDPNSDVNFGFYNGVVYPKEVINEMTKGKTK